MDKKRRLSPDERMKALGAGSIVFAGGTVANSLAGVSAINSIKNDKVYRKELKDSVINYVKSDPNVVLKAEGANGDLYGYATMPKPSELKGVVSKKLREQFLKQVGTDKRIIFAPGNHSAAILHELGHSRNLDRLGKNLFKARIGGLPIAAATPLINAMSKDQDSTLAKSSPIIAAAGVAPMLGDEFAASRFSLKKLKELGATAEELAQGRKTLTKAFGTYAALGASLVAAPYVTRKYIKSREEKMMNKQAEDKPTYPVSRALMTASNIQGLTIPGRMLRRAAQGRKNMGYEGLTSREKELLEKMTSEKDNPNTYPISRTLTSLPFNAAYGALRTAHAGPAAALIGGGIGIGGGILQREIFSRASLGRARTGNQGFTVGDRGLYNTIRKHEKKASFDELIEMIIERSKNGQEST